MPDPQGRGVLVRLSGYVPLVLPSVSARWAPAQHHGEYHPCLSSRQSGKSSPPCQRQSVPPCSANRNSPPGASFPCYPVTCPPPPHLPLEPGWADRSHRVAHATFHAVQPQAPPPAPLPYRVPCRGRPPSRWSCPQCRLSRCVSPRTCTLSAEPRRGQVRAGRPEENASSQRNRRWIRSLLAGAAALAAHTLHSLLSWLTQQTQPWHSSDATALLDGAHASTQHRVIRGQASTSWCAYAVL